MKTTEVKTKTKKMSATLNGKANIENGKFDSLAELLSGGGDGTDALFSSLGCVTHPPLGYCREIVSDRCLKKRTISFSRFSMISTGRLNFQMLSFTWLMPCLLFVTLAGITRSRV